MFWSVDGGVGIAERAGALDAGVELRLLLVFVDVIGSSPIILMARHQTSSGSSFLTGVTPLPLVDLGRAGMVEGRERGRGRELRRWRRTCQSVELLLGLLPRACVG